MFSIEKLIFKYVLFDYFFFIYFRTMEILEIGNNTLMITEKRVSVRELKNCRKDTKFAP